MWGYPDWIDPKVAKEGVAKQGDAAVMYGGLESYHAMCRFYSGWAAALLFKRLRLTDRDAASFSTTSSCSSTTGTGESSPKSPTFATSPSKRH